MLQARRSQTQETAPETEEGIEKDEAGIVPLGIPMLAGPGAISTVMVLMGQSPHFQLWRYVAVFGAILVTALISYLVLRGAERVSRIMGETGIRIMMRVMGLLLTAIAVQFFLNGLIHLKVIKAIQ
jgi:multiple antibiotic resistance protein